MLIGKRDNASILMYDIVCPEVSQGGDNRGDRSKTARDMPWDRGEI